MHDVVKIVSDFHPYPAGRYPDDGEGNGTKFREEFLVPAIKDGKRMGITFESAQLICLDLDSLMIIHKIRW